MQDIVVLIPGILGSVLTKEGKTVWGYSAGRLGSALFTRGNSLRDDLELQVEDDGVTADGLLPDLHLIPGLWKVDGYSKIRRVLCDKLKLTMGRDFFEFPYDWRKDNRIAARRLSRFLEQVIGERRAEGNVGCRAILVTHSMGGLVARYYLEALQGWGDGLVRSLITMGTPFRGSVNALRTLVNGSSVGPIKIESLTAVCRSLPSVYQLLPVFPAYDDGTGHFTRVGETLGIPNVDAGLAGEAMAFHSEIRDAVARNRADPKWESLGYDLYPIVGRGQPTSYSAKLVGDVVETGTTYGGKDLGGDGTVPRVSAVPIEFDAIPRRGDMYTSTKHGSLQNSSEVLDHIVGRINDLYTDYGGFRSWSSPPEEDLAVEVPDAALAGESVLIRIRSTSKRHARVSVISSSQRTPESMIQLVASEDWSDFRIPTPKAGSYTVRVERDGLPPVEDSFAVWSVSEDLRESFDDP